MPVLLQGGQCCEGPRCTVPVHLPSHDHGRLRGELGGGHCVRVATGGRRGRRGDSGGGGGENGGEVEEGRRRLSIYPATIMDGYKVSLRGGGGWVGLERRERRGGAGSGEAAEASGCWMGGSVGCSSTQSHCCSPTQSHCCSSTQSHLWMHATWAHRSPVGMSAGKY